MPATQSMDMRTRGCARLKLLAERGREDSDRLHIRYRFRERYSDGESEIIEQDAYCDLREGAIVAMDLLCSGHRPELPDKVADVHRFDAGDLGCSSGFAGGVPPPDRGNTHWKHPRSCDSRPLSEGGSSVSRLLGHRVISIRNLRDGSTVLVVQRGR